MWVISPEDALVDRLTGWKFWKSGEHGVNAYLLYKAVGGNLDIPRLEERARTEHVLDAARLRTTQQAISQAERWDANPTVALMRRWAEACGAELEIRLVAT